MKIPAGLIGVLRRVRKIVATVGLLNNDLLVRLEVVGAEEQFLAGGEEDVAEDPAPVESHPLLDASGVGHDGGWEISGGHGIRDHLFHADS